MQISGGLPVGTTPNTPFVSHDGDMTLVLPDNSNDNTFLSPAFDVSVQGFDDDEQPASSGADLMAIVVRTLQSAAINCCFAGEASLIYYGAHRMMLDWILCVEDEKIDLASALIKTHDDILQPFRRSAMKPNGTIDHHFPRFKFTGYRCFFHMVPSWVHHIPCTSDSVEISKKGLPFPKLPVYAQSLLETMNLVDIADLVDGMNLDFAWGVEYLDLEGSTDIEWAERRRIFHDECREWPPIFLRKSPRAKIDIWNRIASGDAKARRRGHKALPRDETRFRHKGQKDPREIHMW